MQLCDWLGLTMAIVRGSVDTRRVSSTVSSNIDTYAVMVTVVSRVIGGDFHFVKS